MDSYRLKRYQDILRTGTSAGYSNGVPSHQGNNGQQEGTTRNNGLTTREALSILYDDMLYEVNKTRGEFSKRKFLYWLKESVSFKSELSKMRWPSVLFMTAQAIVHFIVAFVLDVDNLAISWVGFQGFILTILLIFNLVVNLWDTKLRFQELLMKSEQILNLIRKCMNSKRLLKQWKQQNWNSAKAKTLFIPKSPCIHQTLTYRDQSCVNLPDYLLVKGDIIHLFPGERAPSDCVSLDFKTRFNNHEDSHIEESEQVFLREGQIFHEVSIEEDDTYAANQQSSSNPDATRPNFKKNLITHFNHAKLKKAYKGTDFLILSTPYIKCLRISLQRSHKRPVNSVEKECFIISRKYFETFVIPSVFIMSTIVTAIHYGYLDLTDSDQKIKTISIAYLLLRPSLTIMPFLPWMFPCLWLFVNAFGSARLICCGELQKRRSNGLLDGNNQDYSPDQNARGFNNPNFPHKFENLLATPTAAGSSENKNDDEDLQDLQSNIRTMDILRVTWHLIKGKKGHVWRSSSLLQVLGCLTSLCCIDKVGILSWSNPTAEKIFILTKNEDSKPTRQRNTLGIHRVGNIQADDNSNDHDQNMMTINSDTIDQEFSPMNDDQVSNQPSLQAKNLFSNPGKSEVLDVSQTLPNFRGLNLDPITYQKVSKLQFDDLNWRKYLSSLKPLGLAILMNNCCEHSFGDYFRFYKHISYESILRCSLTPVVKRRCICALPKLMGFSRDATQNYRYLNQIGIYKLIDPNSVKEGKFASTLESATKLKLPFSNMTCNIHEDIDTGGCQVFSQGTADIVLDACVEYWDGHQLMPIDEISRKKIKDFYHRTSLTSYCSALAYTPLLLKDHNLGDYYVELPSENTKCIPQLRKLETEHQDKFLQNQVINMIHTSPSMSKSEPHSDYVNRDHVHIDMISDSHELQRATSKTRINIEPGQLITRRHLSNEDLFESSGIERSRSLKKSLKSKKLINTLDELTDQVFVGMVAMQYQACPDFVALVEQLEHACIRFVHFSKENELRSRVFSEKMGLESGWNCHISLQSDKDLDGESYENLSIDKSLLKKNAPASGSFCPTARVKNLLAGSQSGKFPNKPGNNDDDATSNTRSLSSDERTLCSWKSLPSMVMKLTSKIAMEKNHHNYSTPDHNNDAYKMSNNQTGCLVDDAILRHDSSELNVLENENRENSLNNDGKNEPGDNEFESLAFDMSNRAKLPKGIENIRPHLETIDNVPLQVSLFTDCTSELTREMIEIMQDYGEIVCVIGSSSSRMNTPIFLQANASIALEPLLPQSCMKNDHKYAKQQSHGRKMNLRKRSRSRNKTKRHKNDKKVLVKDTDGENEQADLDLENNTTSLQPKMNNPRDRLGIREFPTKPIVKAKEASPETSSSSSSSSTSSEESGSSESSSERSSCSSSAPESDFDDFGDDRLFIESKDVDLLKDLPEPGALASKLASLPCSYSYNRKDPINLYSLIMEARHFTFKMKNTFVCMICFALSISSAQFLASILFLPPMLSSGLTIWLTVVVVPLMSFSLMSTTMDSQVMKIAVGKNLQLKPENITFFVICYLIKFIPSIIVVVLSFGLIISHSCKLTGFGSSSLGPCWMFTYVQHGQNSSNNTNYNSTAVIDEDLLWSIHLLTAQVCAAFLIVLYFVVISAGFVHRSHLMWQKSPTRNRLWVAISLILIFGQLLYNHIILHVNLTSSKISYDFMASLPLHVWVISFLWPLLIIGINLLVKRAEIKATIRQQRRARFDFNTKLGMNSPF